ncbi:MAG: DUF4469 domain-containing protein, partial [Treponema sp.]|nr:DUF4469 domain-containing protein [Treponema sp.]
GGQFSIAGHKLKIAGTDPEVGIYFVSEGDTSLRVKVGGHLAENTAAKLIGVIPVLAAGTWVVEIKTQYSSGSSLLKEPRTIAFKSGLVVKEAS